MRIVKPDTPASALATAPAQPGAAVAPGAPGAPVSAPSEPPAGQPGAVPPAVAAAPIALPQPGARIASPLPVYSGVFGPAQAERLLFRAGFGPALGQAEELALRGLEQAVLSLTRPQGEPRLDGPEPRHEDGTPLSPTSRYGDDHLWWFDRMVRTNQPLVERMTLIWHDWFATSNDQVADATLMLRQNDLLRRNAIGSFETLLFEITEDPAMLVWLDGRSNVKGRPNENYGRELCELFTLGAGNGYTERDVKELARALTGHTQYWDPAAGTHKFGFKPDRHDAGTKTIFGQSGTFDWRDAVRLVLEHPLHPAFLVRRLWAHFIARAPSQSEVKALGDLYRQSGYRIAPVLEAILVHPALYEGGALVKDPAVFVAGVCRRIGRHVDSDAFFYAGERTGQRLFMPPDVSGWDESRWLDTNTTLGRWNSVAAAIEPWRISGDAYDPRETAEEAVLRALAFWRNPRLRRETHDLLLDFARTSVPLDLTQLLDGRLRGQRQNALRQLIGMAPEMQCD